MELKMFSVTSRMRSVASPWRPMGCPPSGVLLDVLQQLVERLRDARGGHAHLLQEALVAGGALRRLHAALHRLGHQLAGFDQLLLAHRGADGRRHHLDGGVGGFKEEEDERGVPRAPVSGGALTRVQATS